jgi:hypothetical protein
MPKLEFFIERRGDHYVLANANGGLHVSTCFPDKASAAETAIRFAQDQDALYALYHWAPT